MAKQPRGEEGKPEDPDVKYLEEGMERLREDDSCHSLLKKHLTRDVLDKLIGKKTESHKSTLRDVVQSGESAKSKLYSFFLLRASLKLTIDGGRIKA